ncbi:DUF1289 domain-containing protein [Halomonas denitrificans]|nr:DUF1289 domain-containing protein [Halomonas denitrificans]
MSDPARELEAIESPCIGVCRLDESGRCLGCFRTAAEIGGWLSMSAEQRREIIDELPQRADRLFDD